MQFSRTTEKAFSVVEVMVALTIIVTAVGLAAGPFKSCGTAHKKIVAGEAAEAEVSLLMSRIEKDFIHSATSTLSGTGRAGYRFGFMLTQSDGVAKTYQAQCRSGSLTPLPMSNWKGDCFRAMACPTGSSSALRTPSGEQFPAGASQGGLFAYALCAQDLGAGGLRIVMDAAVKVDEKQNEPRVITKEKIFSHNAALGGEIQLLPKP